MGFSISDSDSKKETSAAKGKKKVVRVPPKVSRKPQPEEKPAVKVGSESAVAFAMSIVEEKKRAARAEQTLRSESEIRLTRRPTTRTQGTDSVKFSPTDLAEFRRRLLDARETVMAGADAMKATCFSESDDHESDGGDGTAQTLRLQALGQIGNLNRTVQRIEEALHRIEDGSYGVCTVCGQLIRKPRLLNQPFVLTCMECQNDMERSSGA
jgi:DnaK suppressor protein